MNNANFIDSDDHFVKNSNMIDEHQIIKITEKTPELHNIGKIVCGDANSNILTFEINRYYDNIDLLTKNIKFIVKNELGTFTEDAINVQYSNEFLRFSWILSDSVTYKSGNVFAAIIFIGSESGNKYVLKTVPFTIKIETSLDFIEYDIEHKDWFTDIEYRLSILENGIAGTIDKNSLESTLFEGITNTTTLAENDLIPLISESEDGHKSISKAVTLPTLAKEVANNIDIPDGEIDFENLTPVTDLTEDDEFLVGTAEGNKKIGCKALADGLKEMMNLEISTEEVSKIPFIRGFRIYMKDFNVTISANKNTCNICSLSDFGISDTNLVYGINGYTLPSGLHAYVFLDNNTIRIGRSSNFSTSENKVVRICLIVKDTVVTDGAGEEAIPLFPGYDIKTFTKTYNISSGNMGIKLMDLSEVGILEEDVVFVVATCSTNPLIGAGWAGVGVIFENAVYFSASKAASSSLTVPITFSIIYRKEGSVLTGLPDLFTTTDIPMAETITSEDKLLLGTADGNKVVQNDLFIQYLRENGLFDLDGKGRPLLPGYDVLTFDYITYFSNGSASCPRNNNPLPESFNFNDIIFITAEEISQNVSILGASVRNTDKAIVYICNGSARVENCKIRTSIVYKKPVPFEPGLKTVSLTKTLNFNNIQSVEFATLSEFGITNPEYVVSASVMSLGDTRLSGVLPLLKETNIYVCSVNGAVNLQNNKYRVDLIVKDYSSIGPSIVTDGIRMITKEVSFNGNGTTHIRVANVADFGVDLDSVVNLSYVSNSYNLTSGYAYVEGDKGDIHILYNANIPSSSSGNGKLSLFVKVPVVEQKLKPFTKDVEVTLGTNDVVSTGIHLNGSDDVNGFTFDNFHSCTVTPLDPIKWIVGPVVSQSGEVSICRAFANQTGPCKIRIHIE